MDFKSYLAFIKEDIIENPQREEPYDNPDFLNFVQLNWQRTHRWLKKGKLNQETKELIQGIEQPQTWIIITEPWCGDAAHSVPFIQMLSDLNPKIETQFELRDSAPHRINDYLTDGKSRSIPKLIVKDKNGKDLLDWGPRPAELQKKYKELVAQDKDFFKDINVELQNWYNKDKGQMMQQELLSLFKEAMATE